MFESTSTESMQSKFDTYLSTDGINIMEGVRCLDDEQYKKYLELKDLALEIRKWCNDPIDDDEFDFRRGLFISEVRDIVAENAKNGCVELQNILLAHPLIGSDGVVNPLDKSLPNFISAVDIKNEGGIMKLCQDFKIKHME